MAKAVIHAGNCGFVTTVEAEYDGVRRVALKIESDCKAIQQLAKHLTEVDVFNEVMPHNGNRPQVLEAGMKYCSHAACPVPVGIIRAVEVAAGLALPGEASITTSKE